MCTKLIIAMEAWTFDLWYFEEIERLIEYILIDTDTQIDGRFAKAVSIDSHFYFNDIDGVAV
ncbi:MAG: hypothetical protein M3270_04775 [Thermoproteota archaeon]|nr:hypothetical protein [Thermoproteota archaeon]